jgi:hypothetical protein
MKILGVHQNLEDIIKINIGIKKVLNKDCYQNVILTFFVKYKNQGIDSVYLKYIKKRITSK